jgi:hypothetical protein
MMGHGFRSHWLDPRFWLYRAADIWRAVPGVLFVAIVAACLMAVIATHDSGSAATQSGARNPYSPAVQRYFEAIRRKTPRTTTHAAPSNRYSPAVQRYFAALRRKTPTTTTSTLPAVPFVIRKTTSRR